MSSSASYVKRWMQRKNDRAHDYFTGCCDASSHREKPDPLVGTRLVILGEELTPVSESKFSVSRGITEFTKDKEGTTRQIRSNIQATQHRNRLQPGAVRDTAGVGPFGGAAILRGTKRAAVHSSHRDMSSDNRAATE